MGSFLSGGLDTSTVVAFASKHYPHKLKTFCMGFGHEDDELDAAKKVADYFGTVHYGFTITDKETLELYPEMNLAFRAAKTQHIQLVCESICEKVCQGLP